jgi:hypothetical protein
VFFTHQARNFKLEMVGVLVFIDENLCELLPQFFENTGVIFEELVCQQQQIVEIQGIARLEGLPGRISQTWEMRSSYLSKWNGSYVSGSSPLFFDRLIR